MKQKYQFPDAKDDDQHRFGSSPFDQDSQLAEIHFKMWLPLGEEGVGETEVLSLNLGSVAGAC